MKNIYATCVVRPFWFVIDELKLSSENKIIHGPLVRGRHLKYFRKVFPSQIIRRFLIMNKEILSNILLTAFIDTKVRQLNEDFFDICSDIPEIQWFERDVNESKKVDLYYYFLDPHDRDSEWLKNIGDIVLFEEQNEKIFLKFEFDDKEHSEYGTLSINFDENSEINKKSLIWLKEMSSPRVFQNFYQMVSNINNREPLLDDIKLKLNQIKLKLNMDYIDKIIFLNSHQKEFLIEIIRIVNEMNISELPNNFDSLLNYLTNHYKSFGRTCKYALILDDNDLVYSIKIASWEENSNLIL